MLLAVRGCRRRRWRNRACASAPPLSCPSPNARGLNTLIAQGAGRARALTHARILLKANQGEAGPGWTDQVIADALEVHLATVARVRQHYATAGLDAALDRKTPEREYRWWRWRSWSRCRTRRSARP
jgi:hypothetical protein